MLIFSHTRARPTNDDAPAVQSAFARREGKKNRNLWAPKHNHTIAWMNFPFLLSSLSSCSAYLLPPTPQRVANVCLLVGIGTMWFFLYFLFIVAASQLLLSDFGLDSGVSMFFSPHTFRFALWEINAHSLCVLFGFLLFWGGKICFVFRWSVLRFEIIIKVWMCEMICWLKRNCSFFISELYFPLHLSTVGIHDRVKCRADKYGYNWHFPQKWSRIDYQRDVL